MSTNLKMPQKMSGKASRFEFGYIGAESHDAPYVEFFERFRQTLLFSATKQKKRRGQLHINRGREVFKSE